MITILKDTFFHPEHLFKKWAWVRKYRWNDDGSESDSELCRILFAKISEFKHWGLWGLWGLDKRRWFARFVPPAARERRESQSSSWRLESRPGGHLYYVYHLHRLHNIYFQCSDALMIYILLGNAQVFFLLDNLKVLPSLLLLHLLALTCFLSVHHLAKVLILKKSGEKSSSLLSEVNGFAPPPTPPPTLPDSSSHSDSPSPVGQVGLHISLSASHSPLQTIMCLCCLFTCNIIGFRVDT